MTSVRQYGSPVQDKRGIKCVWLETGSGIENVKSREDIPMCNQSHPASIILLHSVDRLDKSD
jgi:hypothetical protein